MSAERVLARLHAAQAAFYAGEDDAAVRDVLTQDIAWHVPGENAIAGDYHGIDEVLAYFARRRDLADRTFRMHPRDILVGDGDHVAALTDGTAVIDGVDREWSNPSGSTGSATTAWRSAGCSRSTRRPSTRSGPREPERGFEPLTPHYKSRALAN